MVTSLFIVTMCDSVHDACVGRNMCATTCTRKLEDTFLVPFLSLHIPGLHSTHLYPPSLRTRTVPNHFSIYPHRVPLVGVVATMGFQRQRWGAQLTLLIL